MHDAHRGVGEVVGFLSQRVSHTQITNRLEFLCVGLLKVLQQSNEQ